MSQLSVLARLVLLSLLPLAAITAAAAAPADSVAACGTAHTHSRGVRASRAAPRVDSPSPHSTTLIKIKNPSTATMVSTTKGVPVTEQRPNGIDKLWFLARGKMLRDGTSTAAPASLSALVKGFC